MFYELFFFLGPTGNARAQLQKEPAPATPGKGFILFLYPFGPAPLQILALMKRIFRLNYSFCYLHSLRILFYYLHAFLFCFTIGTRSNFNCCCLVLFGIVALSTFAQPPQSHPQTNEQTHKLGTDQTSKPTNKNNLFSLFSRIPISMMVLHFIFLVWHMFTCGTFMVLRCCVVFTCVCVWLVLPLLLLLLLF